MPREDADVVVIGAGFGGLGAAIRLAELGARVTLVEALKYPGGCASTFTRGGWRFESGATLSSGFAPGQLFAKWVDTYGLDVTTAALDPVVTLCAPGWRLAVGAERAALVTQLKAFAGAPGERIDAFFARQKAVADALWPIFAGPSMLPPFDRAGVLAHLRNLPAYLRLAPTLGRSLAAVLDDHGLAHFEPLTVYLNAVTQITVQGAVDEVEAPIALAAIDYYYRGTRHVEGGLGALAEALLGLARRLGVTLRMADRVSALTRVDAGWQVEARRGPIRAQQVVCNLLPRAVATLRGAQGGGPRLASLSAAVEEGWGAVMLYLGLAPDAPLRPEAQHFALVTDTAAAFVEGNHVFVSVSGRDEARGPGGARTVTASTHLRLKPFRALSPEAQGRTVARIQAAMRGSLARHLPDLDGAVVHSLPGSPRTFERFTGRPGGYVGGIPRRAGLASYRGLGPCESEPGLWLVGDSVFPGQSTLATALGGVKVAEAAMARA
ncbi:MAG: NAD(P)-binding protein [Myxococcales bacterium]|nr:NAD(P)-binding protein [Myxococcales bacterium]